MEAGFDPKRLLDLLRIAEHGSYNDMPYHLADRDFMRLSIFLDGYRSFNIRNGDGATFGSEMYGYGVLT